MTLSESVGDVVGKNNGASSSRGRRGRPQGSKNKPKEPTIITTESPDAFKAHILEIEAGTDIMECLSNYSHNQGRVMNIMSCNGTVERVTFRQVNGSVVTLQGEFQIQTLSGTLLPHPVAPHLGVLSLYVGGGQRQTIGGNVVPPLVASSHVVISLASFAPVMIERLPLEESDSTSVASSHAT